MLDAAAPRTWKKRPLLLEEVPLPPGGGFSYDVLDPGFKLTQLVDHKIRREEVLRRSLKINQRAKDDPEYADMVIALCRRDVAFWIDHFVVCHEPRNKEDRRLILYPFQKKKIVDPYVRMRDTEPPARVTQLKAKSRDMGVTWVELACRAHSHLFVKGWSILIGGVTQKLVDDGGINATHKTLFGKFRFILRHLPKWMRLKLLGDQWEKPAYTKKLMQVNPMMKENIVEGDSCGDLFARSGRYSEVLIDEFAYADKIKKAEKALKQTTTRFSGNSTPNGRNNLFAQLMFSEEMAVEQYWLWWAEHPEKDLEWFNIQREDMEETDIASELNISFDDSAGDRVLPEVSLAKHFCTRKSMGVGYDRDGDETLWEPSLPLQVVIDFGASHPMAAIWGQWNAKAYPPWGVIIDFVQTQGKSVDWIVPFLTGVKPPGTWRGDPWPHEYSPVEEEMIARHARWLGPISQKRPLDVFGDWQGSTANLVTGSHSAFDELEKYGIIVTPVKVLDDYGSITAARQLMRHVKVDQRLVNQRNGNPKWCPTFAEVLTQWRFKPPQEGQTQSSLKPMHDRFCHGGDCVKMWALTVDLPGVEIAQSVAAGHAVGRRGSDVVRSRYRGGAY